MKKMPKNAEIFHCSSCDFICSKKSNYDAHVLTLKHQKRSFSNILEQKNAEKCQIFSCKNCQRTYSARNSLWYHEKKCTETNNGLKELTNIVLEVVKQNQELMFQNAETQKQNQELTSKVFDLYKNGTINNTLINNNSNNKTFNLNLFLNETCKDAMNIKDFINSVKLQLSDLEKVGEIGYIDGISNIIIKNLKELDITKRPVHCTDKKREVLYIKDEDKWEKEDDQNIKIRSVIKQVAFKNTKLLKKFREKHPDCGKSESKYSDKYNKLIIEAMGGRGDDDSEKENKIIQKIAKEVVIVK
jgi:hypothetical protein